MAKKKEPINKHFSIALDPSVKQAISDIADEENAPLSVMLRKLLAIGLKEYGVEVRGNQVVKA